MEHWRTKHKRHKFQKETIADALSKQVKPELPCQIVLTRIAPRKLDEEDNLPMSMKWVKDAVADWLVPGLRAGRADDDKRLSWAFKQERGAVREYSLVIEFCSAHEAPLAQAG